MIYPIFGIPYFQSVVYPISRTASRNFSFQYLILRNRPTSTSVLPYPASGPDRRVVVLRHHEEVSSWKFPSARLDLEEVQVALLVVIRAVVGEGILMLDFNQFIAAFT